MKLLLTQNEISLNKFGRKKTFYSPGQGATPAPMILFRIFFLLIALSNGQFLLAVPDNKFMTNYRFPARLELTDLHGKVEHIEGQIRSQTPNFCAEAIIGAISLMVSSPLLAEPAFSETFVLLLFFEGPMLFLRLLLTGEEFDRPLREEESIAPLVVPNSNLRVKLRNVILRGGRSAVLENGREVSVDGLYIKAVKRPGEGADVDSVSVRVSSEFVDSQIVSLTDLTFCPSRPLSPIWWLAR